MCQFLKKANVARIMHDLELFQVLEGVLRYIHTQIAEMRMHGIIILLVGETASVLFPNESGSCVLWYDSHRRTQHDFDMGKHGSNSLAAVVSGADELFDLMTKGEQSRSEFRHDVARLW